MTVIFQPEHPERFDEVYSVSDLHFGGEQGFQIFDQGDLFARTMRMLAKLPSERRVALVINGDFVDFLAEPKATYLDVEGAVSKLGRIASDPAFSEAFKALGEFVRTPNRILVISMGNHDVEMALPEGRAFLVEQLCTGEDGELDEAARGRLRFVLDGTGFTAQVGKARALFVHGNEVDAWNIVDHDTLRRVIRDRNMGNPAPPWNSNAGTQLVIDVMNDIKQRYPLVDLLKPETKPVPAVLVALEPSVVKKLATLAPLLVKKKGAGFRMWRAGGLLGEDEAPPRTEAAQLSPDAALRELLPATLRGTDGQELLKRAEAALDAGQSPLDWSTLPGSDPRTLGVGGMMVDLVRGRSPDENLRDALKGWLSKDETFSWSAADETSRDLDKVIGAHIDFLVAGHTHLERSLPRGNGPGHYFNSGTWVQLIHLKEDQLKDPESFAPVLAAFRKGSLAALNEAKLVLRRPTVVAIRSGPDGTRGVLMRAALDGAGARLEEVQGTERVIAR